MALAFLVRQKSKGLDGGGSSLQVLGSIPPPPTYVARSPGVIPTEYLPAE